MALNSFEDIHCKMKGVSVSFANNRLFVVSFFFFFRFCVCMEAFTVRLSKEAF